MSEQKEPFGYFRAEPFGWTDCAETDEGAVALYDQETVNALQGRCDELLKQRDELLYELLSAAKAVIERWDSPLWKDLPPTANVIARLRDAVNKLEGDAEAEANSRRVVACLNACAGISTENLEDNLPVKELADRYNALQKHCDGFAEQAAFQRDARLGALKELAKVEGQRDMLLDVLRKTADDLAYVAHCFDGSKLDDLPAGLSESTCPSETALIAERNCREAIGSVKGGAE